ncbi:MAG: formimidoylglutamate deiminase [Myxococcota bacterium]
MTAIHLRRALLAEQWARGVAFSIDDNGLLAPVVAGPTEAIDGWVIPGMVNGHGHAFQRAMAGLAERRHPARSADSFWTWREEMYRLANHISPEDLEALAAWLYVEMLEAGYTAVAEFHYVHHQPDGRPYADPAAMSRAILRAATRTGIRLTLLPVFYAHGGFTEPLRPLQRRFAHTQVSEFSRVYEALRTERGPLVEVGFAAHSLRAVWPVELMQLCSLPGPAHIHIAEQRAEVTHCLRHHGQRPVDWLLDHVPVDDRWSLIHATHVTTEEVAKMAASGAVVGLCPTTEGNLGDGIFPLADLLEAGGRISIGSDSHITVDPREELRLLEYGQRLRTHARNVAADAAQPSTGQRLWIDAARGGGQSIGHPAGALTAGRCADLVVLDPDNPKLIGHSEATVLDAFIFSSGGASPVRDVMVGGQWVVLDGRHRDRDAIFAAYRSTVERLVKSRG